jgi:hypothetical protein
MAVLLERIRSQGYKVTLLDADKIGIAPPPVPEVRQFVIKHKAELLAELAANDEQFPMHLMQALDRHYKTKLRAIISTYGMTYMHGLICGNGRKMKRSD